MEKNIFCDLLNGVDNIVYIIDKETFELRYANEPALEAFDVQEISSDKCYHIVNKLDEPCPWCPIIDNADLPGEWAYMKAADKWQYYQAKWQNIQWDGKPAYVVYGIDFKDQNVNQKELENQNKALQQIIDNIPAGISVFRVNGDKKANLVATNLYYTKFFGGLTMAFDIQDEDIKTDIPADDIDMVKEKVGLLFGSSGRESLTFRARHDAADEYTWIRVEGQSVIHDDGTGLVYFSYSDITDERQTAEALELSRLKYKVATNQAKLTFWEYDIVGHRIISDNDSFSRYQLGSVIEGVPYSLTSYFEEADADKMVAMYRKIEEGVPTITEDLWYKTASAGTPHCERISYVTSFDETGKPISAFGVGQDVTNEKTAEAEYEKYIEDMYVVDQNSLCAFRLNITNNTCSNAKYHSSEIQNKLMSNTVDELFAKVADLITNDSDKEKFSSRFNRAKLAADFRKGNAASTMRYRRISDDGEFTWVEIHLKLVKNPGNDEIEAFAYSINVENDIEEEQIIRTITGEDYDFIALVNVKTKKVDFKSVSVGSREFAKYQNADYDTILRKMLESSVEYGNVKGYFSDLCYDAFASVLSSHTSYEYSLSVKENGIKCRKHIKFCWLNDDRREVLLTRDDISVAFEKEQRDREKLNEALNEADRANQLKSEFLSNVSHDMRTPLNAVLGYTNLARETEDRGKINDYLTKIDKAGHTLGSLINDTLDLQKIERGVITLNPTPINSKQLVTDIIDSMKPMADAKHVELVVDSAHAANVNVLVDQMRINEILINLVSNSIKFTPQDGRVEVIFECLKLDDDLAHDRIMVRDNGIGMTEEFLPRIFEPFSQERTEATADIGGSGLGLSIVKRLVEMMGGRIEVSSVLGQGTEITMYLDFKRTAENVDVIAKPETEMENLKGIKVLLCEDNAMNTEIARALLESFGVKVICAENGEMGSNIFLASHEGEFSAVLMDIRMPVMNGYKATKIIRESSHPQAKTVPIIAMSADAYEEDVRKSLKAGMNEHIAKPIDSGRLYNALKRMCS